MAHPRMYREDDPFLTELRAICLELPESAEVEAWGRPTFRAGKKMFAVFTGGHEDRFSVIFKPEPDEGPALADDDRFYVRRTSGREVGSRSISRSAGWIGTKSVS